jgi:L-iditol 2-dehydrogenase
LLAAVFRGPGALEVVEVETPEAGPGEVLVEVGANTVCGTDVRVVSGEKARGVAPEVVLGHEFAGRVAGVGRGVEGFEVGASVALAPALVCGRCRYCRRGMHHVCPEKRLVGLALDGGLAQYARISAEAVAAGNLFPAKRGVPFEHLALAEPLACCINGQENYGVEEGDVVLILGGGPIGLFHLQLALLARASAVIVSDPTVLRWRVAETLGATATVDPVSEDLASVVDERTEGFGVDAAVVCAGVPDLVNEAIRLVRKGGRVSVFAGLGGGGWAWVEANLVHYNEISVTGASDCRLDQYEKALRLIESGRINVADMVTHRFPLAEAARAIETSAEATGIKVAVMP